MARAAVGRYIGEVLFPATLNCALLFWRRDNAGGSLWSVHRGWFYFTAFPFPVFPRLVTLRIAEGLASSLFCGASLTPWLV